MVEKPALPLQQERALYLTALSRWLHLLRSIWWTADICLLKRPVFLLHSKAGSRPSCSCTRCITRRHVIACRVPAAKLAASLRHVNMRARTEGQSRANRLVRKWTQPFPRGATLPGGANLQSQSYWFQSNAEAARAEWMDAPHCDWILSKLP